MEETSNGDISEYNPVSAANERNGLSKDLPDRRESSLDELKAKWLNEENSDSFLGSEVQYLNQCEDVSDCLNYLLSSEMTTAYASVSSLFKSFRCLFSIKQKLRNKVFELASERCSVQKQNSEFERQISEREERIQYLEGRLDADVERIQTIEREKAHLESELEELRMKLEEEEEKPQVQEETPQPDFPWKEYRSALEEIDALNSKLTASKSEVKCLEAMNERTHNIENELREEIGRLRKRDGDNAAGKKQLEKEMRELREDLEAARSKSRGLLTELKSCESQLKDSTRHGLLLNKNLAARQFHLTVLKAQREKLEKVANEKQDEVESLKFAMRKVTSTKNDLSRRLSLLEQKLETEKQRGSVSAPQEDTTWRKDVEKDKEIRLLKLEIKKMHIGLNSATETLRSRTEALKTQETVCCDLKKEIRSFQLQARELNKKIKLLEEEKQKMATEISELTAAQSNIQTQLQQSEQNGITKDQEIARLKEEMAEAKERALFYSNNEYEKRKQLQKTRDKLREAVHMQQSFTESTQQHIDRIRDFEDQVQALQRQVIVLKTTNNNVRCTLKQLETRNGELSAQVGRKERVNRSTQELLEERENELNVTKTEIKKLIVDKSAVEVKLAEKLKELALKSDRVECFANDLVKAEIRVKEKEKEMKNLQVECEGLKQSLSVAKKQLQERELMQKQLVKAQSLLDGERLKCKTLEEELQRPKNIHRWRYLEGSDAPVQHLMLKCTHLQKSLLKKSSLLSKKEDDLRNKERMIEDLASGKRGETDAQKKLWSCQKELSNAKNEIKRLLGEKFVYESLSSKHANQIESLKNDLKKANLSKCQHETKKDELSCLP